LSNRCAIGRRPRGRQCAGGTGPATVAPPAPPWPLNPRPRRAGGNTPGADPGTCRRSGQPGGGGQGHRQAADG
jgi:hypothetical protein